MTLGQHIRVLACVVVMGCIVGYVLNASEIETDSPYIDYIKAAQLPFTEEQYIGDVFHGYFELTHWEYFTARQGQHVVQFTGTHGEQQLVFQFIVAKDRSSFELGAIKQNDIVLTSEAKWAYMKQLAAIQKESKAG
ncbi:hypothetical protein NSQ62_10755 [Solibacillus sp. FSL H8-0523]|uniref:hypothetical protein n=1 Tax=Solibacillus sp. FSL H8-0523 TaxID=2954511 RepID=UPI0031016772